MKTAKSFENDDHRIFLKSDGTIVSSSESGRLTLEPGAVDSITVEDDSTVVLIRHSGGQKEPYWASSRDEAGVVAAEIAEHLELGDPLRTKQSIFEAGIIPGSFFLMASLATVLGSVAASIDEDGGPRVGKAAAAKHLIEALGLTGVLVIGGLLSAGTFSYLCYKLFVRQYKTTYSRS